MVDKPNIHLSAFLKDVLDQCDTFFKLCDLQELHRQRLAATTKKVKEQMAEVERSVRVAQAQIDDPAPQVRSTTFEPGENPFATRERA
jgi:hypothetical protein